MRKITKSFLASCMSAALTSVVQAEEVVYEDSSGNLQYVEYVDSPLQPPQTAQTSIDYGSYVSQEDSTDSYQQTDNQVYEQASLQQAPETTQDQYYQQPAVYEQAQEPQQPVAYEQAQEHQQPAVYEQAQEQPIVYEQAQEQPIVYEQAQEQAVVYEQTPTPAQASASLSPDELGERLLTAARAGKLDDVRWLLRKGADPEYKPHANALSPLDLVVKGGWVDVAQVFLDEGVNFNKRGDLGITFLHQAAAAGKLQMVHFLVSAGVSPNITTEKDWTALHHAARFGHADVVSYLLTAGADAEHRNSDGFRPRELAINAQHIQIAQMF